MAGNSEQLEAQLKGKLWYAISRQIERELPLGTTCSASFLNALVELCYLQMVEMGRDLEAFATHAGRNVIEPVDLKLLLRKTPELQEYLFEK